jgi:hypothetical protein
MRGADGGNADPTAGAALAGDVGKAYPPHGWSSVRAGETSPSGSGGPSAGWLVASRLIVLDHIVPGKNQNSARACLTMRVSPVNVAAS